MGRPSKREEEVIDSELETPFEEIVEVKKEENKMEVSKIGLEIISTFENRNKEAEKVYRSLEKSDGSITITNPACGGSVNIKTFEKLPRANTPCTCGKSKHYLIKYTTI